MNRTVLDWNLEAVLRVPKEKLELIVTQKLIRSAINSPMKDSPMEILFDTYEEHLDPQGEHDDFNCYHCRQFILNFWNNVNTFLELNYSKKKNAINESTGANTGEIRTESASVGRDIVAGN